MNSHLNDLISAVKINYNRASNYDLKATYYPYRNVSHTIRIRDGVIYIRVSDKLKNAPDEIITAAGKLLFDKLFRLQTDAQIRHSYRKYVNQYLLPHIEPQRREIADAYTAQGNFYNLDEIFTTVNRKYFNPLLKKPVLGWSMKKSYRRLGFYDSDRNLIVISKIFDKRNVPELVLEYIMFHEMLHILYPAKLVNGRRKVHTEEFNRHEQRFPDYDYAKKWLAKKLWRIRF